MKQYFAYAGAVVFAGGLALAFFHNPALNLSDATLLARLDRDSYSRLVTEPLTKEKRLSELEAVHRSVLKADPGHLGAKIDLGNLLRATNRADRALEWHRSAREESPENLWVVWEMMADLEALGREREALHGADVLIHEAAVLPRPLLTNLESFLEQHHDLARQDRLAETVTE